MITEERWRAAQDSERAWHDDPRWQHVGVEVRNAVRGVLQIPVDVPPRTSVLDVGCGPRSILLDVDVLVQLDRPRCVALDPLRFDPRHEVSYVRAGIAREYGPVESFGTLGRPQLFDEVWCYNCLQHVLDVDAAIRRMLSMAKLGLRLFEWTDTPETVNHPHVLSADALRSALAADQRFTVVREVVGRHKTRDFDQAFFATTLVAR